MKKTRFVMVMVLVLALAILAGCGQQASSAAPAGNKTEEKAFEPVVLKFACSTQESQFDINSNVQALCFFRDEIAKRTNGDVTVEIYWGGALASSNEDIVNGLQTGGFDFNLNGHGTYGDYTDAFFPFSIPYLFLSDEDYAAFVEDPEIFSMVAEKFEADTGIKLLSIWDTGFRNMTSNKGFVKSPDDMKGLKLRTMSDPYQIAAMQTLGAAVTPIAWGDLFTALQQGLCDAQENPILLINSAKLYEVQKYLTLTRHNVSASPITMNKAAFDTLPEKYQQVILEVAKETTAFQREKLYELNEVLMQRLIDNGMEVYDPTPEELAKFQEIVKGSWPTIAQDVGQERFDFVVNKALAIQESLGM